MARIETGVDKLVDLVKREKRIEIREAAKRLGVDKAVVQEWAEFLEEEGLCSIDYNLSKTFIVEKRLSKSEVGKKEKEYESKKEAFIRRVDAALHQIDDETAGFEQIKEHYNAVRDKIGDQIDLVKDELEQLRHYEELKKTIDSDILKQKVQYQRSLDEIHTRLSSEERRYEKILKQIEEEEKRLAGEKTEFDDLKKEEHDLLKRIDALESLIKRAHSRILTSENALETHMERLTTLRELADKLKEDLIEKRKREIEPLLRVSDDQAKRIMRIQDEIVTKVKKGREHMHDFEKESKELSSHFESFFDRRARTEQQIRDLERAKHEMKEQLNELIRKAKAFEVSKNADTSKHIKELETRFKMFDLRRKAFSRQLEYLKHIIMGDDKPTAKKPRRTVRKSTKKKTRKRSRGK